MWFVPFLLACALPVQGELKLTLEQSTYSADDSGTVLEVSYEIPSTSLAFLREDSGFVARYQISIQATDKRNDVVAGDLWQRVVRLREYGPTMARDSVEAGTVRLALPKSALDARVAVNDQGSERSALARFRIEQQTGGLSVRLYKSGKPVSMRKYGIGDTLVAVAEATGGSGDSPHAGTVPLDSCRFALKHDRRVVTGATIPATMDEGRETKVLQSRFEYPIGDSAGVARLGGGEYSLEVVGFGAGSTLRATVGFRIDVPFFLDDSVYLHRVGQLTYVASNEDLKGLRSIPRGERQQAWREFWKKREQTPIKGRYVNEEEYFERIDYAQEHFGHADRGYLSDRGHAYVLYGAPDQIESRPFDIDTPAYEVWYYYQINKEFRFVDRFGAGEYVLQNREEL
jgi:GWxTD domain-containing protein